MGSHEAVTNLPDAISPDLHLAQATPEEKKLTWALNSVSWKGALSKEDYLEREPYLTTVPLAKEGGITHWVLVDKNLRPNARPLLASCESLRKRALVSHDGVVTAVIAHGIGSVFSSPQFRGKGYASRMMKELGATLRTWQKHAETTGRERCAFSILYSDIGRKFYAGHGWHPFPSTHIAFPPVAGKATTATPLRAKDLAPLCALDERYVRRTLEQAEDGKTHVALIPDHDTMQWHHMREEFVSGKIFGEIPSIKGAIIGENGCRVWMIWTRAFYGPFVPESGNTLHILRLVLEDETNSKENVEKLGSCLEIAQAEAAAWKLLHVELWNPSKVVKALIIKTGLEHSEVQREEESITSLMWYGEGSGKTDEIEWVGNEKFGWC